MATEEQKSVIHRKAMGGRDEFDARVMSPSKALRLALAKVSANMFGLAVTVTTVQQVKLANKDIQAEAGDDGLLLLLDGVAGARGAAKVDCQFLTALIEVQTTGSVRRTEAEDRPVTRTDAAIAAPLLDAVLARYDDQLADALPGFQKENYRFGDMIDDARSLALALEAPDFDLYRLTLDIDDGAKTGVLTLLLPHRKIPRDTEKTGEAHKGGSASLAKNALEAPVAIDAVLTRVKMPLKEICELAPGMVLPLDATCLKDAELVASDGQIIARVSLGQMNGMRAVMCVAPLTAEPETVADADVTPPKPERITKKPAPRAAKPADVLDGHAEPVPQRDASRNGQPVPDAPAPGPKPAKATNADDAEDDDELSPADLMLAAQSLTASVREEA